MISKNVVKRREKNTKKISQTLKAHITGTVWQVQLKFGISFILSAITFFDITIDEMAISLWRNHQKCFVNGFLDMKLIER